MDNAVRLSKALERRGLDAYYFVHKTGLYKVRFGNFPTKKAARKKAEAVRAAGIIDEYYLVSPNEYAVAKQKERGGRSYLRNEIVGTARKFIGVPYRWGGSSRREGFPMSAFMWAKVSLFTLLAGAKEYGPNALQKDISRIDMLGLEPI